MALRGCACPLCRMPSPSPAHTPTCTTQLLLAVHHHHAPNRFEEFAAPDNSICPLDIELKWMTEVSSSVYATPLITDLYADGRKDIIVPGEWLVGWLWGLFVSKQVCMCDGGLSPTPLHQTHVSIPSLSLTHCVCMYTHTLQQTHTHPPIRLCALHRGA